MLLRTLRTTTRTRLRFQMLKEPTQTRKLQPAMSQLNPLRKKGFRTVVYLGRMDKRAKMLLEGEFVDERRVEGRTLRTAQRILGKRKFDEGGSN